MISPCFPPSLVQLDNRRILSDPEHGPALGWVVDPALHHVPKINISFGINRQRRFSRKESSFNSSLHCFTIRNFHILCTRIGYRVRVARPKPPLSQRLRSFRFRFSFGGSFAAATATGGIFLSNQNQVAKSDLCWRVDQILGLVEC